VSDSVTPAADNTVNADGGTGAPAAVTTPVATDTPVNTVVEDVVTTEVTYPEGITVPEGNAEFKVLYAKKSDAFWQGFQDIIKKLMAEGKTCKETRDLVADKIKEIANNDDYTQCHIRNFHKVNVNELYKMINKKAGKYSIEGWKVE
jgi:hypothetical protein